MAFAQVKKMTPEEVAALSVDDLAAMSGWPRRMAAEAIGMLSTPKEKSAYDGMKPKEQAEKIAEHAAKTVGSGSKKAAARTPSNESTSKRTPRNTSKKTEEEEKPKPAPVATSAKAEPVSAASAAALEELKSQLSDANKNIEALVEMVDGMQKNAQVQDRMLKALLIGTGMIAEAAYEGMKVQDYLQESFAGADQFDNGDQEGNG